MDIVDKIEEILSESFDTKVEIKTVRNTENEIEYNFDINGTVYYFFADGDYDWSIVFGIEDAHGYDKKYGIIGKGNQMKVFAAVAQCFDMFLKAKKPNIIWFEAEETSRRKLYNRFAKMITQKYPYKAIDPSILHDDDIEQYSFKIYAFKRKQ